MVRDKGKNRCQSSPEAVEDEVARLYETTGRLIDKFECVIFLWALSGSFVLENSPRRLHREVTVSHSLQFLEEAVRRIFVDTFFLLSS